MFAESLAQSWWLLLFRGVVAVLFGLLALTSPGLTLIALTLAFAVLVLIDGVLLIAAAFAGRKDGEYWWLTLLEGLAALVFGGLALWAPGVTAFVLLMYIAAFALVTGVLRIIEAVRLRKEIEGEWLLALSGIVGVTFAVLMLAMPGAGALALAIYIGSWAIIVGVSLIALAFRVRKLGRTTSGDEWRGRPATAH